MNKTEKNSNIKMPKPSQMLDGPDMRAFLGACLIYYGRVGGGR